MASGFFPLYSLPNFEIIFRALLWLEYFSRGNVEVVILDNDKQAKVLDCVNTHPIKEKYFRIDPDEYLHFKINSTILSIFHSHVNESERPSEYDKDMVWNSTINILAESRTNTFLRISLLNKVLNDNNCAGKKDEAKSVEYFFCKIFALLCKSMSFASWSIVGKIHLNVLFNKYKFVFQ